MKRTILFTVAAAVLAAVASIPLMAQPQGRGAGGRDFGPGGPGGFGPLAVLRDLNLSDAQREQIRAITEDRRATRIAQVLTPEQRNQARDAVAKTGPRDGGRGRRGRR